MREILFAGLGGQGVLTCGLIVAEVALFNGRTATWSPSYGSAMRGGAANCTVKYSREMVYNPSLDEPDLLLAMSESALALHGHLVKKGGIVLVNSDLVGGEGFGRTDVSVHRVPCSSLAQRIGQPKGANVIMTAAIIKLLGDFGFEDGMRGMNDMFRKKGKERFEKGNSAAFEAGYSAV
ncbi:2-oxoacid:acceptor oxidoreductase family protein [Desulfocurvus sp.]|jgi:2-oxoglutarate ferredoxin oxidoreductase subunit gamma|uniref:2-oxoacid:acceptor oxidoreductase family protein n=1 Tax=Desulfocurvus sp. TaxID=2871698 RepID=UPI0025C68A28|nr:2-oxoacid:acceptor oxidoreductase family protein [Desulfocurvus sp.]MCK9239298.1 2-oxoacid:acceptor oxidoreductase family protein [Desulfocurvus sp.]